MPDQQFSSGVPVRRGAFLYDKTLVCDVRVVRSEVCYGSGDHEDPPELAEDQSVPCFYVEYGSTTQRGGWLAACSGGGGLRCPSDAGFIGLEPGRVMVGAQIFESEKGTEGDVTRSGPLEISVYQRTMCCNWSTGVRLGDPGVLQCGEDVTLDGGWGRSSYSMSTGGSSTGGTGSTAIGVVRLLDETGLFEFQITGEHKKADGGVSKLSMSGVGRR